MKAITEAPDLAELEAQLVATKGSGVASDFIELIKMRLNVMVLITTLIGFVVAADGPINWWLLFETMIGTGLCAAGACVLNEAWEHLHDRKMARTANRPVAAGRITPHDATMLGLLIAACGLTTLALTVNLLAASLALSTIVLYVLVYTPLKRVTTLNTLVGAIPGAIPPMIGFAGASNTLGLEAWGLFAILFCWQMPHFLAIAILCKDDYAAAGFKMMPVVDHTMTRTAVWIVAFGALLIGASMIPLAVQPTSVLYTAAALLLGGGFLAAGVRCAILRTRPAARTAFFASILYLPLALGALMIDRLL